jgi:hypothetical protein
MTSALPDVMRFIDNPSRWRRWTWGYFEFHEDLLMRDKVQTSEKFRRCTLNHGFVENQNAAKLTVLAE